jgi:hypothetical protein
MRSTAKKSACTSKSDTQPAAVDPFHGEIVRVGKESFSPPLLSANPFALTVPKIVSNLTPVLDVFIYC